MTMRRVFVGILLAAGFLFFAFAGQTRKPALHVVPGSAAAVAALPGPTPPAQTPSGEFLPVERVIDGDTIKINIAGKLESVRLIGINAPESVDPYKPVECYGKQASADLTALLSGTAITLVADPTQTDRDKYDRLLRYVFLSDGRLVNELLISNGDAREYTFKVPYRYQTKFKNAQTAAQAARIGLWNESVCP